MTHERNEHIRTSWQRLDADRESFVAAIYRRWELDDPSVAAHLAGLDVATRVRELARVLARVVDTIDDPSLALRDVIALTRVHCALGLRDQHVDGFGVALLTSLEQHLGDAFRPDVRRAWREAFHLLAAVIRRTATVWPAAVAPNDTTIPSLPGDFR